MSENARSLSALPIISAAGVEAGILPTAVLSTHTAFPKFTFKDLTDEIQPIIDTFSELKLDFDAVYTGYLGSFEQLKLVGDFIDNSKSDMAVFIDPVMADNGVLYKASHRSSPTIWRSSAQKQTSSCRI